MDMSLSELEAYTGSGIKAADFDEYWARALDALDAVDPQAELLPAAFPLASAECFDLYFTGVGGARIHAKYIRPKTPGKHPCGLYFHGYTYFSGDWSLLLPYVAEGMCIAALDCRGQSGLSQDVTVINGSTIDPHLMRGIDDDPDKLIFRQNYLDTVEMARIVEKFDEVDPDRMAAFGGSQGGGLALACSALYGKTKLTVCEVPFLADFYRGWQTRENLLPDSAYREIALYFSRHDPLHQREKEIFEKMSYFDVQYLAPRIRSRVVMSTGLQDGIVPPSTQYAIYNRLTCEKEHYVYPEHGHETATGWPDIQLQLLRGV